MAKAKAMNEMVAVTLDLTLWEARVLRTVCDKIGGSPSGCRGAMDNIGSALDSAGIGSFGDSADTTGNIYFEVKR